jgi:hypothetical protein
LEFIFPQMLWQTAAYRPGRSAEFLLALNDVAWLCYVGIVGTAIAQMAIVAIAIFQDQRREPLVPRWCAYLCLWCSFGGRGRQLVHLLHIGPVRLERSDCLVAAGILVLHLDGHHDLLHAAYEPQHR